MMFRLSGSSARSAAVQTPPETTAGRPLTVTSGELPETVPVTVTTASVRTAPSAGEVMAMTGGPARSMVKLTEAVACRPRASVAVAARVWSPAPSIGVPEVKAAPSRVAVIAASGSLERISGLTVRVKIAPAAIGSPPSRISTVGSMELTVKLRWKVAELPAASVSTISAVFAPSLQANGSMLKDAPETVAPRRLTVAAASSESATPEKASMPAASNAPSSGMVEIRTGAVRSIAKKA